MDTFYNFMNSIYPLSDNVLNLLLENMKEEEFKKGEFLIRENEYNKNTYFMLSGFARVFSLIENKEQVAWFVKPQQFVTYNLGIPYNRRSLVSIQFIENSKLLSISREKFEKLLLEDIELSTWSRKYLEIVIYELELFFTSSFFMDATKQYEDILRKESELVQKVPLKYLASYLNIAPESLSRIRAKLTKKK
ncbi:MAG: cyclic nucleotide-binding domain-containing protein [Marinifilaceae bacterium]|nr:cyclic nucleotide-binding domain-containing protein [Marinilabiliaceae bacterium JC040]MCT4599474.1 cyclic nucleotide-binding domain-containing protein [Marinifilaceae bacterium]